MMNFEWGRKIVIQHFSAHSKFKICMFFWILFSSFVVNPEVSHTRQLNFLIYVRKVPEARNIGRK